MDIQMIKMYYLIESNEELYDYFMKIIQSKNIGKGERLKAAYKEIDSLGDQFYDSYDQLGIKTEKLKSLGLELTKDEINYFINGMLDGSIPDYQISALLMAIVLKDMTDKETIFLTDAMIRSGEVIDLRKVNGIIVDIRSK